MTRKSLAQNSLSLLVGFVFAIGLAISGMTQPQKIIAFLNPWDWDASLLFVMFGAIGVHIIFYPLIRKRRAPLLDSIWHIPNRNDITTRLILGSALFGIGWGLGGFCPGPALVSLASGDGRVIIFCIGMIAGMILFKKTSHTMRLGD